MALTHATWLITSKCNLACSYCFTRFNKDFAQEDSTFEVGKATVDLILMSSTKPNVGLGFFGGEPLLKFDLMREVVDYAQAQATKARKRFNFSVTTNGVLMDERVIRWFKEKGIRPLVSLDGMPHDCNKRLFPDGTPSAEMVLEHAQHALDAGLRMTIRWSLHPEHLPYFAADVKELVRRGFDVIAVDPVYEVTWTENDFSLYEEQLREVGRFYISCLRNGRRIMVKPIDDAFAMFTMDEKQKTRCGTATDGVGVGPDGKIYPCHRYVTRMGPVVGSVFEGWNEDALRAVQAWDVSKVRPEEGGSCADCPVNLRCPGGGCLCVNLDVCGDVYISPSVYCRLERIDQRVANDVVFILYAEKNAILMDKLQKPDVKT